jgi:hypothetical protein
MDDNISTHNFVLAQNARPAIGGGIPAGRPAGRVDEFIVADVNYTAATEEPGRLRYPVGGDTELIIGTKSAMSFEDFDTTMRAALNWNE